MPVALVTGITGQDGSYLAELLHERSYEIHGIFRPGDQGAGEFQALTVNTVVHRHTAAVEDYQAIRQIVASVRPDECYHLAAYTVVAAESSQDANIFSVNTLGAQHVLAAVAEEAPSCRVFFAGSSEMFGQVETTPQTEETPMRPDTMYGVSKLAAYEVLRYYRQVRGIHASCGILYNHESPRRSPAFVSRKITSAVGKIKTRGQAELCLGNLDDQRDWGHARDYVRGMWLMLQNRTPDDYILATGRLNSVRDFVQAAFARAGLDWRGYVTTDPRFYRPPRAVPLAGCADKARKVLGWTATTDFAALVAEMVDYDLTRESREPAGEPR